MPTPKTRSPRAPTRRARAPLTRERVVKAALAVVDKHGVDALSMRAVAAKLGVEAMSLYRHVAGKEDLVLGVADLVLSQVEVPPPGTPWRAAMRRRACSARAAFLAHPAAALLVESCRTMSPARLTYADAIAGLLMADGFDATRAYRAFLLLDSYIYGFTMQELSWPRSASPAEMPPAAAPPVAQYPHFAAMMAAAMAAVGERGLLQSYADEFEVGLELVLDALARLRGA